MSITEWSDAARAAALKARQAGRGAARKTARDPKARSRAMAERKAIASRQEDVGSVLNQIDALVEWESGLRFVDLEYDDAPMMPKGDKTIKTSGRFADLDLDELPVSAIKKVAKSVKAAAAPHEKPKAGMDMDKLKKLADSLKIRPHQTDPTMITVKMPGSDASTQKKLQQVLSDYYGFTGNIPVLSGSKYTMAFIPKQEWDKAELAKKAS